MIPSAQPAPTPIAIPTAVPTPTKPDKVPEEKKPSRNSAEVVREQAMKSVAKFNKQLNQERKEERPCSMDLQSFTINYPVGLGIRHKQYDKHWKRHGKWMPTRKISNFPIALIPEQYQDIIDQYSSAKLAELPVKKAKLYRDIDREKLPKNLPEMQLEEYYDLSESDDDIENCDCHIDEVNKKPEPEVVNNDDVFLAALKQKLKSGSTNSVSGSSVGPITPSKPGIIASLSASLTNNVPSNSPAAHGPMYQSECKVCKSEMTMASLVKCSDCGIASHDTCLDISGELLAVIRQYEWQCTDCKVCTQCRQPHDEDKMMFCDKCDRGYHTYCIGVNSIPAGHWVCSLCAFCVDCNRKTLPKINGVLTDWQHKFITFPGPNATKFKRHQVYCYDCYQLLK